MHVGTTLPPTCVYKDVSWSLSNEAIVVNIIILLVAVGLMLLVFVVKISKSKAR